MTNSKFQFNSTQRRIWFTFLSYNKTLATSRKIRKKYDHFYNLLRSLYNLSFSIKNNFIYLFWNENLFFLYRKTPFFFIKSILLLTTYFFYQQSNFFLTPTMVSFSITKTKCIFIDQKNNDQNEIKKECKRMCKFHGFWSKKCNDIASNCS